MRAQRETEVKRGAQDGLDQKEEKERSEREKEKGFAEDSFMVNEMLNREENREFVVYYTT